VTKEAKRAIRASIAARRAARTAVERAADDAARSRSLLALAELVEARTVAAYWPFGDEPDTSAAIAALAARHVRVLLPRAGGSGLVWSSYTSSKDLQPGPWRSLEPSGPAVPLAEADVVIVPALAVDGSGRRLGRGSGMYDRALRDVRSGVEIIALVYDDEVLDAVPSEPHDCAVSVIVTPARVLRCIRSY
jgi:5-formyltetrahydrofolate cyclo-ligase